MRLHFPISEIRKGIEELKTGKETRPNYDWDKGEQVPADRGFLFVGDQGVYLMPNTTDGKYNSQKEKDSTNFVIYANECNPDILPFDEWYDNKRAYWGGDDGSEYIGLQEIEAIMPKEKSIKHLVIDMKKDSFSIGFA